MLGAPTGRRGCLDINEIFILMLSDLDIPSSARGVRRGSGKVRCSIQARGNHKPPTFLHHITPGLTSG
jgi:hypothetical protein